MEYKNNKRSMEFLAMIDTNVNILNKWIYEMALKQIW